MKRKIGCIGVGKMGGGVCHNLILAGNDVTVFDMNKEAAEKFAGEAQIADTMEKVFENSDVIFLSLPNSDVVESVIDKLIAFGAKGKLVVDISTSYPGSTRKIHERLLAEGANIIDAPLLAGPKEAWEGTLPTALGGDKEVVEEYDDVFASYSGTHEYVGNSGTGHLVKLAQNWAGLVQVVMYAQLYPVMAHHGIPTEEMYNILNTEYYANWFFERYSQKYIKREYKPAFALELGLKDLNYMKRLCDDAGVPGFMLDGAIEMARVTLKEHKDRNEYADFSSICETMYQYAHVEKK